MHPFRRLAVIVVFAISGCSQSTTITSSASIATQDNLAQVTNTPNATGIAFAQVQPRAVPPDWKPTPPPVYQIGGPPPDLSGHLQAISDYVNYAGADESRLKLALVNSPGGTARTDFTWILNADLDSDGVAEYLVSFPEYRTLTHGLSSTVRLRPARQEDQPGFYCERLGFCLHFVVLFELENGVYVPKTGIGAFGELVSLDAPSVVQISDLTNDGVPEVVVRGLDGNAGDRVYIGSWKNGWWSNYLELNAVEKLSIVDQNGNGLSEVSACNAGNYRGDPNLRFVVSNTYEWYSDQVILGEWIPMDHHERISASECS